MKIRDHILLTLRPAASSSANDRIILEDVSASRKISIGTLRSMLYHFIFSSTSTSHFFAPRNNDANNNDSIVDTDFVSMWNVVALEISDVFPLAIAELACVLAGLPFLPLDAFDPASYRCRQGELCRVNKVIRQGDVEKFLDDYFSLDNFGNNNNNNRNNSDENHVGQEQWDRLNELSTTSSSFSSSSSEMMMTPLYLIFTSGSTLNSPTITQTTTTTTTTSIPIPKCLVVDDENLITYLSAISKTLNLHSSTNDCSTRIFCLSSPTFDPSIGDIFSVFFHPSTCSLLPRQQPTLVCASKHQILSNVTKCLVQAGRITHIITSPALWKNVDVDDEDFRRTFFFSSSSSSSSFGAKLLVALGGEAIPLSMMQKWRNHIQLCSIFGLTEATIYQCLRRFSSDDSDNFRNGSANDEDAATKMNLIGKPLCGGDDDVIKLFVFSSSSGSDEQAEELEAEEKNNGDGNDSEFVTGELIIQSKQVVRGALAFSPPSLSEVGNQKVVFKPFENHILRTGDLVRVPKRFIVDSRRGADDDDSSSSSLLFLQQEIIFPSNNINSAFIELLGRIDFQVKISGRRVSLEDVEGTVEGCLSSLIDKCVAIVNKQGTGIIALVTMMMTEQQKQQQSKLYKLQEKIFRFIVNLSLREREQLTDVFIWRESSDPNNSNSDTCAASFPMTKNGKIDRKNVAQGYYSFYDSSSSTTEQVEKMDDDEDDNELAKQNQNFSSTPRHHHHHQKQQQCHHPMRIELENLVREIWSEALGVDQKLLRGNSSNFFVLGGDSLLCVKVSRETLYAVFPDEGDDRTPTTPKRRQRKGDLASWLKNEREVRTMTTTRTNDGHNNNNNNNINNKTNDEEAEEGKKKVRQVTANLHVDEFGAFKGPIQPRVLLQHPFFNDYCDALWKEVCSFAGIKNVVNSNSGSNEHKIEGEEDSSTSSSSDPTILLFSELLSESIEENDELSLSILLNYNRCLKALDIEPVQQLGLSAITATFADSSDLKSNSGKAPTTNTTSDKRPRIAFPLHHAVQKNHLNLVRLLVTRFGCKPTDFNLSSHVTALHVAAQLPDPAILAFLIETGKGPIQVRDARFQTLLHYSARAGVLETTRWLLRKCAAGSSASESDVDASRNYRHDNESSNNLLNSMIVARDRWQRTPLHWAIVNNHVEVVRCLVEEGEVNYFSDRRPNQLLRLSAQRTSLPYQSPLELAKRMYEGGDDSDGSGIPSLRSEMVGLVMKSKLN